MIWSQFITRHEAAPINCASGCASPYADIIHASIRAEHRGDAFVSQVEYDQLEIEWEAWADGERAEDTVTIEDLEDKLERARSFGRWPWDKDE